jgi:hypothetical protein
MQDSSIVSLLEGTRVVLVSSSSGVGALRGSTLLKKSGCERLRLQGRRGSAALSPASVEFLHITL